MPKAATKAELSDAVREKALLVSEAIQVYLLETGERDAAPAALTPHLVEKGLFSKEYERPGLPLRNLLENLEEADQLSLIPQVTRQYRGKRRYWLFNPVTDDDAGNASSPLRDMLERQVEQRLREQGIVVWLDREGSYSEFVDGLAHRHKRGKFFAPVVRFRGSFLDTMFEMENFLDGLDPEPLLIHLPGHTDQSIRTTPLLEAYKCGKRFERSLDTLVRDAAAGKATPQETEEFLNQTTLSFQEAEQWLSGTSDVSSGLADLLQSLKPEWVLDSLARQDEDFVKRHKSFELRDYLERHTGLSAEFDSFVHNGHQSETHMALRDTFLAWVLCVEYVYDLNREPQMEVLKPLKALSPPLQKTSRQLCEYFRKHHEELYREVADLTQSLVENDLSSGSAQELGKIDTFSREDSRLLEAAVEALGQERWKEASRWATARLESPSVWIRRDQVRRQEWALVKIAAELGETILRSGRPLQKADSLEDALEIYTGRDKQAFSDGAQAVDRAHRRFEQDQSRLLTAKLPHFGLLQEAAAKLRELYRSWVDQLSRDFALLCAQHGYIPRPDLQQRTLYEQEVHPRVQSEGAIALFLVDALRYEMACELARRMDDKKAKVHLKSRLAELPSITSVGMNVLAPVCQDGKLTVKGDFEGFRVGEYTVSSNQYRLRAMGERSLERQAKGRRTPLEFKLQALSNTSQQKLKAKVKESALVVVHSREIDESGEADVGLTAFDRWIGQLRSAILHLQAAGVEEFVITADHGFLLLDNSSHQVRYNSGKVDRRWVLTDSFENHEDMTTVSLDSLGYYGREGHLMFLRDSRVFDTKGKSARTFVHGGNSLQERVIPVLHISYRKTTDLNLNQYRLTAEVLPPVMNLSRLKIKLLKTNEEAGLLDFAPGEKVTVALRVVSQPGQVVIKDAVNAEVFNQQLILEEDKEVEVYFSLQGSGGGRASIELFHPDGLKKVEPFRPSAFFPVDLVRGQSAPEPTPEPEESHWVDNLPENVREVFLHIEQHGMITEAEVTGKLGNPRKVRRFTNNFEDYLKCLPFLIRIESSATGKKWIKEP